MHYDAFFLAQTPAPPATAPAPAEGEDTTASTTTAPGGDPAAVPPRQVSLFQHPMFGLTLVIVVFYIVLFWGRGKRQRQVDKMLQNVKKNDRIVTIGGIVGTVVSSTDDHVVVKVDESSNTKMTFVRKAIQRVDRDE